MSTPTTPLAVLVTGGSGFLGSSVVRGLAEAGHRVTSADLRAPATPVPGVDHVVLDVTDRAGVLTGVKEASPDVVVHLASIVTPGKDSSRERERAVDVDGTRHVLDACLAAGVRRVVVSSSGAAYGYHPDNGAAHGGWVTEDDPVRGNVEFAYSDHKRQVEEMLAELRATHPELEQVVLRIGTILGERVDNQITALFEKRRLLKIRGADSPFVFIWDTDVVAIIERAVTGPVTGIFNVAGDGALSIDEIAARLGRPVLAVPESVVRAALAVGSRLGLTAYGPEQTRFLRYRPVLANDRLKDVFGYVPSRTSAEAFEAWRMRRSG
ncbi:NAD-dependent epimerase/dehydratase family protein [Nocardioides sp. dk4132]|uniref:SDR family oxidoreductase n=1 Tax=unclassified Nocardioides TaxID=2615069 RepID=UPI001294CD7C|nr:MULTISPECIES: SDR family oxidoreductase [unclassified Nocardioides]MQW74816.1 NAD-dependent epimerase/dehydratase family protein [Nocardioides sp. dk4132]QGA06708.1 NAD-dependent epimerase/dehydratase family protein [Nocardioides sp. dk884]